MLTSIHVLSANHLQFYHGKKLDTNNVLSTINVHSTTECAVRCSDTDSCNAINVMQDSPDRECILISANSSDISGLITDLNWQSGITDICNIITCENNGSCIEGADLSSICDCSPIYSGQFCDVLTCDAISNGACFLYHSNEVNWHDAKEDCNRFGGRLAELRYGSIIGDVSFACVSFVVCVLRKLVLIHSLLDISHMFCCI